MVIVPGSPLKFTPDQRKSLSRHLESIVGPAMAQHAKLGKQIELQWEWYAAKPLSETRSTPFVNASNVVFPLIKMHADSIQARRLLTLLATHDVWVSHSRNEKWSEVSGQIVQFVNHEADDNAFDLRTPLSDVLLEGTICPDGVMALQWGDRIRHRFVPGEREARTVKLNQGPHLFPVPRGQIYWQADRSLNNSEYVIRVSHMTWAELVRAVQFGGWDEAAVKSIRGTTSEDSASYAAGLSLTDIAPQGPDRYRPYEILECWLELPLVRGKLADYEKSSDIPLDIALPAVVAYIEKRTMTVLHVMAHPYPIAGWPFYQFSYMRAAERGMARGLAKDLDHMQRAASTMINQAIDAITLQNSIMGLTADPDLVGKRWTPGQLQYTQDPTLTSFNIRPSAIVQPNVQLIQLILATAERLTGMSDPAFGREMRMGGHPSPATSTLALLQQGQTRLSRTLSFDRQELSRLGEDIAALYQHYEAKEQSGRIARVLGAGDAMKLQEWLFPTDGVAGRIEFDVRAMTENLNPDAEMQKAVQVDQVVTNFYAKMLQGLNVAAQVMQAPPQLQQPMMQTLFYSFDAFIASTKRVLDAANVDNMEELIGYLRDGQRGDLAAIDQAQLAAQAGLREFASGPAGPAVATGPGGAPAAAPGAFADPGLAAHGGAPAA